MSHIPSDWAKMSHIDSIEPQKAKKGKTTDTKNKWATRSHNLPKWAIMCPIKKKWAKTSHSKPEWATLNWNKSEWVKLSTMSRNKLAYNNLYSPKISQNESKSTKVRHKEPQCTTLTWNKSQWDTNSSNEAK